MQQQQVVRLRTTKDEINCTYCFQKYHQQLLQYLPTIQHCNFQHIHIRI